MDLPPLWVGRDDPGPRGPASLGPTSQEGSNSSVQVCGALRPCTQGPRFSPLLLTRPSQAHLGQDPPRQVNHPGHFLKTQTQAFPERV